MILTRSAPARVARKWPAFAAAAPKTRTSRASTDQDSKDVCGARCCAPGREGTATLSAGCLCRGLLHLTARQRNLQIPLAQRTPRRQRIDDSSKNRALRVRTDFHRIADPHRSTKPNHPAALFLIVSNQFFRWQKRSAHLRRAVISPAMAALSGKIFPATGKRTSSSIRMCSLQMDSNSAIVSRKSRPSSAASCPVDRPQRAAHRRADVRSRAAREFRRPLSLRDDQSAAGEGTVILPHPRCASAPRLGNTATHYQAQHAGQIRAAGE